MEEIAEHQLRLHPLLGGPSRRKKKRPAKIELIGSDFGHHTEGEPPGLRDSTDSEGEEGVRKRGESRMKKWRTSDQRSERWKSQSKASDAFLAACEESDEDGDFGKSNHKTTAREDLKARPIELVALQVLRMLQANHITSREYDSESEISVSDFKEYESEEDGRHLTEESQHDETRQRHSSSVRRVPQSEGHLPIGNGLSVMQEKPGRTISIISKPDEWVQITVTVDSGACVTVMPSGICLGIPIVDNDLSRAGVEYEVANGESIPNLGERQCQVMTVGSMTPKKITFQIAEVHKPLLSVAACSDMGFDCFLGQEGGSLKDRITGECIPLERHGSLYSMKMWVRQNPEIPTQGFSGPG